VRAVALASRCGGQRPWSGQRWSEARPDERTLGRLPAAGEMTKTSFYRRAAGHITLLVMGRRAGAGRRSARWVRRWRTGAWRIGSRRSSASRPARARRRLGWLPRFSASIRPAGSWSWLLLATYEPSSRSNSRRMRSSTNLECSRKRLGRRVSSRCLDVPLTGHRLSPTMRSSPSRTRSAPRTTSRVDFRRGTCSIWW
jgi:hypothetical protein